MIFEQNLIFRMNGQSITIEGICSTTEVTANIRTTLSEQLLL